MSDILDQEQGNPPENAQFDAVLSDEDQFIALKGYLWEEISDVLSSRSELEDNWSEFRRISMAKPRDPVKNTPWPNASNVASRVTMSVINTLYAYMKSTFKVRKPLFSCQSADASLIDYARVAQDMVNTVGESKSHINIREKNSNIFYDLIRMGTHFVEVPWRVENWTFKRTDASGNIEVANSVVYDAPDVNSFRIEDVITRPQWPDIQKSPWIALRFRYMDYELRQFESNGFFQNVDEVLAGGEVVYEEDENRENENEHVGYTADYSKSKNEIYEIYKVYVFWDGDGDGLAEPLIIWYHLKNDVVLRAEFNEIGRRPIARVPYIPLPGQLYALGVGHVAKDLQEEIDTLRNIRVNSMQMSSLQILGVARSADFGPNEMLKPGKILKLDLPNQDVVPITFPDVSGSSFTGEQIAKQELMEGTGANQAMMGQPDQVAKSGTSTSLQTFLAQQGGSVAAAIQESVEDGYGYIGLYILMQLVNNTERSKENILPLLPEEDQQIATEILNMNVEDIATTFKFSVETTDVQKTDEARRQQILMIHELYNRYTQEIMQVYQIMLSPQLPQEMRQFASKVYVGKTKLLERALEMFGEKETEDFLPYYKDVEMMNEMVRSMKQIFVSQMEAQNGGNTGIGGRITGGTGGAQASAGEPRVGNPAAAPQGAEGGNPPQAPQ